MAITIAERSLWIGNVRIVVRRAGLQAQVTHLTNLVTDVGKGVLAEALRTASAAPEITWVAGGGNATAPAAGDTTLYDENGRRQVTAQSVGASINQTITTVYLGPNDANGQINELGWFADASSAKDSGILIARVLYSKLKDEEEAIQIERTDTIG